MERMNFGAAAVFVKTIGKTPLKTRLAKTIGEEKAHEFYRLSCGEIQGTIASLGSDLVQGYWSVAEGEKEFSSWTGLHTMAQGTGGLGDRLHYVYSTLLETHAFAILLGADCPQLNKETLLKGIAMGKQGDFVFGPASDGGFYFLLGSKPIPAEIWQNTPYSSSNTLSTLADQLSKIAKIQYLQPLTDVDEYDDLLQLRASYDNPTTDLGRWLQKL